MLISAAHKSSGKTVVATGLCAALAKRGAVQAFKKGPDYIDPAWLSLASARACYNLDFNTQTQSEIDNLFADRTRAAGAEFRIIEANKGLYDGVDPSGTDSNAALAQLLDCPVVLVIDCEGMTRGIAPLLRGYTEFETQINIAGVVLNRTAGERHRSKLQAAVEQYTDLTVFGALERTPELVLPERHLGLVPASEYDKAQAFVEGACGRIEAELDINALARLAQCPGRENSVTNDQAPLPPADLTIGVFKDAAFCFYYPDDLERFAQCGAQLVEIDGLNDSTLPSVDGLFIGGGFPETQAQMLSDNTSLREAVAQAIEAGLPCYAECGGLMYLSRSLKVGDAVYPMCGVVDAQAVLYEKPQGRGYAAFSENSAMPWKQQLDPAVRLPAHEFHYSKLTDFKSDPTFAFELSRGVGVMSSKDGIVYKNLLASYVHRRSTEADPWVERFVAFVRNTRAD